VLKLPAALTIPDARTVGPRLVADMASENGPVTVDASGLSNFDTSAIATLLELRRHARVAGRDFSVAGAPKAMIDLARLYGVSDLLGLATGT
jgi:phospholipid transport system transporter-binding protein